MSLVSAQPPFLPYTAIGKPSKTRTHQRPIRRNIAIDLLGLALIMLSAMWLGASAALSVTSAGAGQVWSLLAGMVVGFGAALVAGKVWGKAAEPMKVKAA